MSHLSRELLTSSKTEEAVVLGEDFLLYFFHGRDDIFAAREV